MNHVAVALGQIARAAEEAEFDPNSVTPGVIGFVVTALLALAVIFLGFDLVRRLRRSRYRHEIGEALAAEIAERDTAPDAAPDAEGTDAPPRA